MVQSRQFSVGTHTRLLRVAAGLTQQDLATLAGVERRRLSEFERNQAKALGPDAVIRVLGVLTDANTGQNAGGGMAANRWLNILTKSSKPAVIRKDVSAEGPSTDKEPQSVDSALPDEARQ